VETGLKRRPGGGHDSSSDVKREPISIIFGVRSLEETLHQRVVNLSTSPEICHRTTL